MAVSQSLQLRDGMSAVLQRISARMDAVNQRFERMQSLAAQTAPTDLYSGLQADLAAVRQEVQRTADDFDALRESMQNAQPPANNLMTTLRHLGTAFVGSKIVSGLVGMSDTLTQTTARLNLMNDGLQSTADLQEMIYQSALRSRGVYADTAAAVSKMGLLAPDAFANNEETIAFVEQLNKQFKIAGTSQEGQAAAMLQLTQAMGAGVLRGEELNSVFEQAPTIIQAINDYLGITTGELRDMAADGQITAEIVKNAMFAAADETNARFESIPMTWTDVWTQATNMAVMALQPLLTGINWVANNLDIIAPLVLATATAFAIFAVAANWTNLCAAATNALATAQRILNTVMALNPVVLIIGSLIILIGVIFAVVAAMNKAKGTTISALGVITGAFAVAGAFIYNTFYLPVWNLFADLCNFIGNVFNDPVAAVEILFLQLSQRVVGFVRDMVEKIESLINLIPGVEVNITGGLDSFYDSYSQRIQQIKDESGWQEFVQRKEAIDYSVAYNVGYNWGANLQDSIADKLNFSTDLSGIDIPTAADPTSLLSDIADNTDQIADDVELSSEDLELLRDIAERQEINRYTTAEVRVEMVNHNTISSEMDIDGVVNLLEAKVQEQMAVAAEGVHI